MAVVGGESALRLLTLALADDAREVQIAAARALGVVGRAACFRDPSEPEAASSSLRAVIDIVTRSMDVELVATTIRTVGEDLALDAGDARALQAANTILSVLEPLVRDPMAPLPLRPSNPLAACLALRKVAKRRACRCSSASR